MFGLRLPELLIILAVLVLLFGAKKLPDLGDALGKGIRAFRKGADRGFDQDETGGAAPEKEQARLPDPGARTSPPPAPAEEPAKKA